MKMAVFVDIFTNLKPQQISVAHWFFFIINSIDIEFDAHISKP